MTPPGVEQTSFIPIGGRPSPVGAMGESDDDAPGR